MPCYSVIYPTECRALDSAIGRVPEVEGVIIFPHSLCVPIIACIYGLIRPPEVSTYHRVIANDAQIRGAPDASLIWQVCILLS